MFDKNYLGHDFNEHYYKIDDIFICQKCCCEIYYSIKNKEYEMFNKFSRDSMWTELNITCDEVIIKRILE